MNQTKPNQCGFDWIGWCGFVETIQYVVFDVKIKLKSKNTTYFQHCFKGFAIRHLL